jgi:hypothetical protein
MKMKSTVGAGRSKGSFNFCCCCEAGGDSAMFSLRASPPVYHNRTITIKSGSHKDMRHIFMDTVENVSTTGTAITIKFMVMVMAAINSGSSWRDFPKTINTRHKPSLRSTYCGN